MNLLNEDTLVQQTTAEYLEEQLGWNSVFAHNTETFGLEGTLGRASDRDIVLTRHLGEALITLNPGLPDAAYRDALRQIIDTPIVQSTLQINKDKYSLLRDGVKVQYRNSEGQLEKRMLRVFDFNEPENNHFLCVRELWIRGDIYRRRADLIGFVNGLPLLFMECKNIHKDIRRAYEENLSDYKDTVPHLFHHNAFIILGNGLEAKIGSLSSGYIHFNEWKRLAEDEPGVVDMETLLKGICNKRDFLDLFENFVVFDDSGGMLAKIIARNHQFLGVNRAVAAAKDREARQGKLGVFWHTQGSGKSYSMIFLTRKIHRTVGGNFTFLICTDRGDLNGQIYKTFAGCGLVDNDRDECRAGSGDHLELLLEQHKAYVFTLIQKFNKDVDPDNPYSDRDDIIVITDEAHRTQYGRLSLNMRNALPNASYIGFTGTPLFKDDEITSRVFGSYISTYDFQRAVGDNATVPLYYDARGEKLDLSTNDLNERIAAKIEEFEIEDMNIADRLGKELKRDYHMITADVRLDKIASDFVQHYSTQWETGKALVICIDKVTCVRMHNLIVKHWQEHIKALEMDIGASYDEQETIQRRRQFEWMKETKMAVVVSEEQGEVAKFGKWDLKIMPHRKLMKGGFETKDGKRIDIETAFKKDDHPFRVAIVCAMWLTGFDVKSLATLYLDKPLKAHTLMQAIARANRVHEGKNNGLIIDYCGILKNLRKALAIFAGHQGASSVDEPDIPREVDPVRPEEDLLAELEESFEVLCSFLDRCYVRLDDVIKLSGFARNKAIRDAKEAVNKSEETRKRFEIICREAFKKFKACLTIKGVNKYRHTYDAINIVYKSLQEDVEKADITDIIRALHEIIAESLKTTECNYGQEDRKYDISGIDFDRLRKEFELSPAKNTVTFTLKEMIEQRLQKMLVQNPKRMDFQSRYEEIIAKYNSEKDRVTIERTFEELLKLAYSLGREERRAVREGLDEESLAIFDMLLKPDLSKKDTIHLKKVAKGLDTILKDEIARIQNFASKQITRDAIKVKIKDYLWDDRTGLPESFASYEIEEKTDVVFAHLLASVWHHTWRGWESGIG